MNIPEYALLGEEKAMLALRAIYAESGYMPYTMSKFEEYDIYAKNRAFLKEDIITFTAPTGKLMALKPDVTLSIVKNDTGEGKTRKVFYNENVYRQMGSTHEVREIMQSGLECIGDIDLFSVCEVLELASRSLNALGGENLLVVSHMGFVSGLLDGTELSNAEKSEILDCISAKNGHSLRDKCAILGLDNDLTERLAALADLYAPLDKSIAMLRELSTNDLTNSAVSELEAIALALDSSVKDINSSKIIVDFSLVNDMRYYNGIIFQGFISGVPEAVLSGGRYDKLLERFGKKGGAIGFAVYLDLLSRVNKQPVEYDVDTLLIYGEDNSPKEVFALMAQLQSEGKTVRAQKEDNGDVRYREKLTITAGGVE